MATKYEIFLLQAVARIMNLSYFASLPFFFLHKILIDPHKRIKKKKNERFGLIFDFRPGQIINAKRLWEMKPNKLPAISFMK